MTINVTKKHINAGIPCHPKACPIALALKDAGFDNPIVGTTDFNYGPDSLSCLSLPTHVWRWRSAFDQRRANCRPVSFELEVPA